MTSILRRCAALAVGLLLLTAATLSTAPAARADPGTEPPLEYRTSVWSPQIHERLTFPAVVTTSVHVSVVDGGRYFDGGGLAADLWLLPQQGDPLHVARVTTDVHGRASWTGPLPFSVDNRGLAWSHEGGESWRDGLTGRSNHSGPSLPIDRAVKATASAPRSVGFRRTTTLSARLRWSDRESGRVTDGGPAAGARWALWSRNAGGGAWQVVARGTADAAGRASVTRTFTRTADWAWTGGGDAYGMVSDHPEGTVQRVSVERATRVSFTMATGTAVWPHVTSKGHWVNSHRVPATATVRWSDDGSAAAGVDGQFCLRRLGTKTWRCHAFQPTNRAGRISASLWTPAHAEVQVRVRRTIAGQTALPATSKTRTLRVRSHVTLDREDARTWSRTVTLEGRAGITRGAQVQIFDGRRRIATVRTDSDGFFRLRKKVATGRHSFVAKVARTGGYEGSTSATRTVTVRTR